MGHIAKWKDDANDTIYSGQVWYVNQAIGNDANSGRRLGEEWQTIGKAQDIADEGDTIIVYDGDYGEFAESTTRTGYVRYLAADGNYPTLTNIVIGGDVNACLEFNGFTISSGVSIPAITRVKFRNCTISIDGDYAISGTGSDYITIDNCEIYQNQPSFLEYGRYWVVRNSTVTASSIVADGTLISNYHTVLNYPTESTIQIFTSNTEIPDTYTWAIEESPAGSSPSISNSAYKNPVITINANGFYVISLTYTLYGKSRTEYAYVNTLTACKYIRQDATGNGTGSDWVNAYTALPSTLARGTVYYVADGEYSTYYSYDDAESGLYPIIIKKGINGTSTTSHGTNTGWTSDMGDGQAEFSRCEVIRDFYIWDGQTGGGVNSWTSGHGIKFDYNLNPQSSGTMSRYLIYFRGPSNYALNLANDCQWRHVEFEHEGVDTSLNYASRIMSWYNITDINEGSHNFYVTHCYFHDVCTQHISTVRTTNFRTEHSCFARNASSVAVHGESWQDYYSVDFTFRWNRMIDIEGTAYLAIKMSAATVDNFVDWYVYGNIAYYTAEYLASGLGGIGGCGWCGVSGVDPDNYVSNIQVHHNTVAFLDGLNCASYLYNDDGTSRIYNNLFISNPCGVKWLAGNVYDYNALYNNGEMYQTVMADHDEVLETDPCTNSATYDFSLTRAIPGLTQSAPYNIDMYGRTNNDKGALAYVA